jgi:hypothetical protein
VADTVALWRPVGPKELALIEASGWRAFPPRLPEQPIFCPVLNEVYAAQIARDWNAASVDTGCRGFVARPQVRADFLSSYEMHNVGASWHREYWIPAKDMDAFTAAIAGPIEAVAEYRGESPRSSEPSAPGQAPDA